MEAQMAMNRLALTCFSLSATILAGSGFAVGSVPLGCCGIFAGLVAAVLVLLDAEMRGLLVVLVLLVLVAAVGALFGLNPYLLALAASSALVGWEFGLTAGQTRPFSKQDVARFAGKKLASLAGIGAGSLALTAIAFQARFRLSFGLALGLGLAALALLGLVFRSTATRARSKF
jgi:hypothetical protein